MDKSNDAIIPREVVMSDILINFLRRQSPGSSSRSSKGGAVKGKVQWRDEDDPRILYRLSKRAKRISLRLDNSERTILVTVPGERAIAKARSFVKAQADWINVQFETLPSPQPFAPGVHITLRGEQYVLVRPEGRGRPYLDHDNRQIIVPAPEGAFDGRVRRLLIREAREMLGAATNKYADMVGVPVEKISVRDTSSRWGSCIVRQGKGHISYSWRLICAPDHVLDYVCAHECAHMIEANHSRAYWKVVSDICPDNRRSRHWLKHNGALLHAVGASY